MDEKVWKIDSQTKKKEVELKSITKEVKQHELELSFA